MGTFGAYTEDRMAVAQTILAQLGGAGRLAMMVGAKNFVSTPNSVSFKLGGGAKKGINGVRITLDPSDTYTVQFLKISRASGRVSSIGLPAAAPRVVAEFTDVYADRLMDVFEQATGFYLTLTPRR